MATYSSSLSTARSRYWERFPVHVSGHFVAALVCRVSPFLSLGSVWHCLIEVEDVGDWEFWRWGWNHGVLFWHLQNLGGRCSELSEWFRRHTTERVSFLGGTSGLGFRGFRILFNPELTLLLVKGHVFKELVLQGGLGVLRLWKVCGICCKFCSINFTGLASTEVGFISPLFPFCFSNLVMMQNFTLHIDRQCRGFKVLGSV